MSDLRPSLAAYGSRNHATSLARSPLARPLHAVSAVARRAFPLGLLASVQLAGCVLPPSLQVGAEDAAVNSPPAITSLSIDGQQETPPGSLEFRVGATPTMTVNVVDTDLGDTLYVRAYIDYEQPGNELDARSKCIAAPAATNPSVARTTTCDLRSLCIASDVTTIPPTAPPNYPPGLHDLTIVVFDREPLDTGAPAFQAMPPGGLSSSVYFRAFCRS